MRAFTLLTLLIPLTLAAPTDPLASRQSATTCGSNKYTTSQVTKAANAACNYIQQGSTAGSSKYPEKYNDYEGFDFPVSSPYYEFPILESGVYSGGSPGADRVVINSNCQYAGTITHTGASGNDFVGCSGTS